MAAAAKAPAAYNIKYDPDKRKDLYDKFDTQQKGLAKIEQDKKDKLAAHQQLVKDLAPQIQAANKLTGKAKTAALNPLNKKINDSLAAYNAYVKNDIPKLTKEVQTAFAPFAKDYAAAKKEYDALAGQAKKINMDPDDYVNQLTQQTKQRTDEANLAATAKGLGISVDQLKQMQTQKAQTSIDAENLAQQKALKAKDDAAAAQTAAAQQAQVQAQQQQMAQLMAQRKAQNDAQVYNLLTQNMPTPVGYQQGPTSREAQTTVIGAGGDQGGIYGPQQQMSPAQIAQMSQGMYGPPGMPPQGIAQQMPPQLPPQLLAMLQAQQAQQAPQPAPQQQAPQTTQAPVMAAHGGIMWGYR